MRESVGKHLKAPDPSIEKLERKKERRKQIRNKKQTKPRKRRERLRECE
jgi:hypothetical protein